MWDEAEQVCATYSGHLTSVRHRSELEWMLSWINTTEAMWIGLRRNSEGKQISKEFCGVEKLFL